MAEIEVIFFDIGGVLGTNGWDHEQRGAAVQHFGLDAAEFEYRHREAVSPWEEGRMTIDEYLDLTVFYEPRAFTRQAFCDFMFGLSQPFPEAVALARALRDTRRYRLMTLNNESRELNQYRVQHFGLCGIFDAFLTSCYLWARKPVHAFYERALGIAQIHPGNAVFVDDRVQNLAPAQALGLRTVHCTSTADTVRQLAALGVTVPPELAGSTP